MTEKRMHFVKNKKIILLLSWSDRAKFPDGVILLSTSCGVLQGLLTIFFYVFDIANELLTRHSPFAPFDRLFPSVKAYSVYIINKIIHSRYGISFLVIKLKRNLNLRAPMYYSLFIFCTATWSCCVIRKIFSSGVTVILEWTIFSLRKLH